jgi:hypothetical protein
MATKFPYNTDYTPAFPAISIQIVNEEKSLCTDTIPALLDTGSDGTLVPFSLLQEILAPALIDSRIRSHWGEWRTVQTFAVGIKLDEFTLPNVFVVGDDQGDEVILGRDVINKLRLLLDGPTHITTIR